MPTFVLSWNVAGWGPTYGLISSHFDGLECWLDRMQCDVLCIQETKVKSTQVCGAPGESLGAQKLQGWKSYWAFNKNKSSGLNGVATFVREDTVPVLAATQEVLGDAALDGEGRCLMTDHGDWCILNVYAPFVGAGAKSRVALERKMRFLAALERRMVKLRAACRHVLLVGDMNLTHRPFDVSLSRRMLHLSPCDGVVEDGPAACAGAAVPELADTWCSIADLCKRLEVELDAFEGYGAAPHLASEPKAVSWLQALISDSGSWVDVFAACHPTARGRFTAWNQQLNLRYRNAGSRLDYAICDKEAWDKGLLIRSPTSGLPGAAPDAGVSSESSEAARNATTNFGRWHAASGAGLASGEGLSLQADDMRLNEGQFHGARSTGLVYTPPAYSDHIPVSVLLAGTLGSPDGVGKPLTSKAETAACQPWAAQRSLSTFFSPRAATKRVATDEVLASSQKQPKTSDDRGGASSVTTADGDRKV